ncbi:MAG TPA: hypothetical protein VLB29_16690, partial [Nocardioidaceae bacterium]|nr:hypothetical protein [Nocardioidaceae bacterium]
MARRLVVTTAAAALGAGVAVAVVAGSDGELPPGPMDKPNQHVWGTHAESGVPFTDGLETVVVKGDKEAEIVSIEVDGDDRIETLGYKLVGPERGFGSIQVMEGWPPSDPELDERLLVPAIGAVLQTWS